MWDALFLCPDVGIKFPKWELGFFKTTITEKETYEFIQRSEGGCHGPAGR